MKTLLKLSIVAVMLVLGVSSCLKEDDSLSIRTSAPYLLQTEDGKFIPQMRVESQELKSASLMVDGKSFSFESITSPSFLWELPNSLNGLDSVPAASTLNLTGLNEKVETHQIGFYPAVKKVGDIGVDSLVYNSTDHKIEIKFASEVENATSYYLLIKYPFGKGFSTSYTMWIPYTLEFEGKKLSTTVSCEGLVKNSTYKFAVGAGYGSVIKIGREMEATMAK